MQQADRAHSATGTIASPGINESKSATRRGVLGALVAIPTIAISTLGAAAPVISPGWTALQRRYEKAAHAAHDYWETVYQPIRRRVDQQIGKQPSLWIDLPEGHYPKRLLVRPENTEGSVDFAFRAEARQKANEYKTWFARGLKFEAAPDFEAASSRMDALWTLEEEARTALMTAPAPHASALALKVQLMLGNDEIWDADRMALLADAARLAA